MVQGKGGEIIGEREIGELREADEKATIQKTLTLRHHTHSRTT